MKSVLSLIWLAALLSLTGCGTLAVSLEATPTPVIPTATPVQAIDPTYTPVPLTPAIWTPIPAESCPPFVFEDVLPQNPDAAGSYLGHHYDDLNMPSGLEFRAAAVIDVAQDIYAWVNVARPDHQMFWLEKFVCRDLNGRAYYEIISAINAPTEGYQYTRSDAGCVDSSGKAADIFLVFGFYDLNETPAPIDKWTMFDLDYAIQLDLAHERFSAVPTTGLTCFHAIGPGGYPQ